MSGIDCTDPNHQRCESCSGCIPCGCLCHLCGAGGDEPDLEATEDLRVPEMGLQPFSAEAPCPKCYGENMKVEFHESLIVHVGDAEFPCATWARKGILTGAIGEHLCIRCLRCNYGRPAATADRA